MAASGHVDTGLTNGTQYTYRVTAVDRSQNESAPSAEVSATPARGTLVMSYQPGSRTILTGTVYSGRGAVSRLAADDGVRLELTAAQSGSTRVSDFYAAATISAAERATLSRLTVDYDGNATGLATSLELMVYDWASASWVRVGGPWTGRTTDFGHVWSTTTSPTDFVAAGGQIRFRVRGTNPNGFRTRTDLIRFTVEY